MKSRLCGAIIAASLAMQGAAAGHALECPPGPLVGVQVLSAKHGEAIEEASPPDLVPDDQTTPAGVIHQVWRMNGEGPGWDYFVWCRYQGSARVVKLTAPGVKRCERTLPAAHTDQPPQTMVCD